MRNKPVAQNLHTLPDLLHMKTADNQSVWSKWAFPFAYKGRGYRLFKLSDSKVAPYYVHLQRAKRRYKQCLETPIRNVAIKRAKKYIDDVLGEKWSDVERLKVRHRASNLEDVLRVYRLRHGLTKRSARNNELAMLTIIKRVTGKAEIDPKRVTLSFINDDLPVRFQDTVCAEYCAVAKKDEPSQREARERALRSSRSTINQARSIFTRQEAHDLRGIYKKEGLQVPECVNGFMTVKLRGSRPKTNYNPVPDSVIDRTFERIEEVKPYDIELYKAFWLDVGAGLRRGEFLRVEREHFVERDGMMWISGGIGKDGERIEVPIQSRAWEALKPLLPEKGRVIKSSEVAKRLCHWLRFQGWMTQKKAHELRAYVGSLIYQKSPHAAMAFMRHKSISITERYYVRYGQAKPVDVL